MRPKATIAEIVTAVAMTGIAVVLFACLLAGCATTNPGFGAPYEAATGETCAMWHEQKPGGYCEAILCRPEGRDAYVERDTCSNEWFDGEGETL